MTTRPIRPGREIMVGMFGGHRLAQILGASVPTAVPIALLADRHPARHHDTLGLTWVDTRQPTPCVRCASDVALHLLWARPTGDATVDVWSGSSGWPIQHVWVPGDFLLVPAGIPFRLGAGAVAVIASTKELLEVPEGKPPRNHPAPFAPSHGLSVFDGYNRQTFGIATPALAITRWKLTQPQFLPLPLDRPVWLANLATPLTIAWPRGMEQLERVETRLIPPGLPLTVYPNDLGYVLVAWVPDLEREVIPPLRSAGYTRAEIATLGVPPDILG